MLAKLRSQASFIKLVEEKGEYFIIINSEKAHAGTFTLTLILSLETELLSAENVIQITVEIADSRPQEVTAEESSETPTETVEE